MHRLIEKELGESGRTESVGNAFKGSANGICLDVELGLSSGYLRFHSAENMFADRNASEKTGSRPDVYSKLKNNGVTGEMSYVL